MNCIVFARVHRKQLDKIVLPQFNSLRTRDIMRRFPCASSNLYAYANVQIEIHMCATAKLGLCELLLLCLLHFKTKTLFTVSCHWQMHQTRTPLRLFPAVTCFHKVIKRRSTWKTVIQEWRVRKVEVISIWHWLRVTIAVLENSRILGDSIPQSELLGVCWWIIIRNQIESPQFWTVQHGLELCKSVFLNRIHNWKNRSEQPWESYLWQCIPTKASQNTEQSVPFPQIFPGILVLCVVYVATENIFSNVLVWFQNLSRKTSIIRVQRDCEVWLKNVTHCTQHGISTILK